MKANINLDQVVYSFKDKRSADNFYECISKIMKSERLEGNSILVYSILAEEAEKKMKKLLEEGRI